MIDLDFEKENHKIDKIYLNNIRRVAKGKSLLSKKITKSQLKSKVYFRTNIIFNPFSEICTSVDSLINILVYLNFPVPAEYASEVSTWSYIIYNVENHLHEIYILKVRLDRYISTLKAHYNRHPNWKIIRAELDNIKTIIDTKFKWIIDTRGAHVHEERFTEPKLDQIRYFELLSKSNDKNFVRLLEVPLDIAISEWKVKWEWIMKNNIEILITILDNYFESLLKILQDPMNNEDIIYPEDIK